VTATQLYQRYKSLQFICNAIPSLM
jgi:hypothetical protein